MGRMFGTDGIRGIANTEITCDMAMKIGAAGAYVLTNEVRRPRILVGCDTRKSGDMLCAAIIAGICSVGGDVINVGVVPTPALAYLVRLYGADAAVMISASHNTMEYNGIKWFDGKGFKLSDALEDRIEEIIKSGMQIKLPVGEAVGQMIPVAKAKENYIEFLISASSQRCDGMRIVLDCANGSAYDIAPKVFTTLGAQVLAFSDEPDGCNINDNCGSTHPERLQQLVREHGADLGFAFDGDADRLIACDEHGNIVDGDLIMGICARHLNAIGKLKHNTLVVTVMSNLGLKLKLRSEGINIAETAVGDRYVLENMLANGYCLGGEQSGHVIFLDHSTTGDGLLSAVQLLNALKTGKMKLSSLAKEIPIFPQVLVNVEVEQNIKSKAMQDGDLTSKIDEIIKKHGDQGRVLVRPSGTEPLIRIMLEGRDESVILADALEIAEILEIKYHGKIRNR